VSQELEQIVIDMFEAFDAGDFEAIYAQLSDDVQTVEELTQQWNRGRASVEGAFDAIKGAVTDCESSASDFNVVTSGDLAIITCVLNQTYVLEGNSVAIVAPTTSVLRLEDGAWKFALVHSIPFA
jgi:ketosteroid isomerase-like protein